MSNLVDFLPILQHIPSPMLIRGKRLHRALVDTYGGMIEDIAQKLKRGSDVKDCLAKAMIQSCKDEKLDDLDMTILASAFMIGGVETVSTSTL
jgi:cytochrome P450